MKIRKDFILKTMIFHLSNVNTIALNSGVKLLSQLSGRWAS